MQGSQTGLPKQNDGAREGERMRERMSGAERVLHERRRYRDKERSVVTQWFSELSDYTADARPVSLRVGVPTV